MTTGGTRWKPVTRLYLFILQQIHRLGQDSADGRFLGPKALCLDCCVKIFFFMTVWQVRLVDDLSDLPEMVVDGRFSGRVPK